MEAGAQAASPITSNSGREKKDHTLLILSLLYSSLHSSGLMPRNGAAHSGLFLPTSVDNQDNPPRLHTSQPDLESLLPGDTKLYQVEITQHTYHCGYRELHFTSAPCISKTGMKTKNVVSIRGDNAFKAPTQLQSMPKLSAAPRHLATSLESRHLEEFVRSHTRLPRTFHGMCHVTGQIISCADC